MKPYPYIVYLSFLNSPVTGRFFLFSETFTAETFYTYWEPEYFLFD